jgi:hypothetical protein
MSQRYRSAADFRIALERRLKDEAGATGIRLDRLRRQVMVERFLARVESADAGRWVLKGAVALEARLGARARATADVDLGLRAAAARDGLEEITDHLVRVVNTRPGDFFELQLRDVRRMAIANAGDIGRARIAVRLAGREFGGFQVDVAARERELGATERLTLPGRLAFAGIDPPEVEIVVLARHVAEKFAGMTRTFDDRDNTRVRDLVDLVLLDELGLIEIGDAAGAVTDVWAERGEAVPARLSALPGSWPARYELMAAELGLGVGTFAEAEAVVRRIWAEMFPDGAVD